MRLVLEVEFDDCLLCFLKKIAMSWFRSISKYCDMPLSNSKFLLYKRNSLMPGGNKKVTYTVSLFKYVWPFCYHQALKG